MEEQNTATTSAPVQPIVMLLVSPLEFAKLWGELIEAYHGCNGFGSDTAELYSYRFQRMNPIVHTDSMKDCEQRREAEWGHYFQAARCLHSLVEVFCSEMGCSATIDGVDPEEWIDAMACNQDRFDHRSHVRIIAT